MPDPLLKTVGVGAGARLKPDGESAKMRTTNMPKGYWVGRVDVIKPEGYQAYGVALAEALRKYGAKFLVRGGTFEAVEGKARGRNIVLEFKDYATALACYRSPEYAGAKALRAGAVDIDIIVIEGYDGPQPTN